MESSLSWFSFLSIYFIFPFHFSERGMLFSRGVIYLHHSSIDRLGPFLLAWISMSILFQSEKLLVSTLLAYNLCQGFRYPLSS